MGKEKKNMKTIHCSCSFCGANNEDKDIPFFKGKDGTFICADCVGTCAEVLNSGFLTEGGLEEDESSEAEGLEEDESSEADELSQKEESLKPKDIKTFLDDYVIGQEEAKKSLAVAVYNHYKRIHRKTKVELSKSNVLLLGPTGSGKTLLAQTLARKLEVPFAIADATTLTEAGFAGQDVESVLSKLLQAANGDLDKAEKGIVYIDEIDKLAIRKVGSHESLGQGVQQSLLKLLEGTIAEVPVNPTARGPMQKFVPMDTSNILFICGGAFVGMETREKETGLTRSIGFQQQASALKVLPDSDFHDTQMLEKFGMMPELIGRLPVIVTLEELDEEAMVRILTEPKNALVKQYEELFRMDDVQLVFEKEALKEIASECLKKKTGARGLKNVLERSIRDLMYEVPSDPTVYKCVITKDVIQGHAPVTIFREGSEERERFSA